MWRKLNLEVISTLILASMPQNVPPSNNAVNLSNQELLLRSKKTGQRTVLKRETAGETRQESAEFPTLYKSYHLLRHSNNLI